MWKGYSCAPYTDDQDNPRAALPQVVVQLRGMTGLLESMTPAEYGSRG